MFEEIDRTDVPGAGGISRYPARVGRLTNSNSRAGPPAPLSRARGQAT